MRLRLPLPGGDRPGPVPRQAYRDSALVYGLLAIVLAVVVLLTGGGVLKAVSVAVACFVLAVGWTWWRLRERDRLGEGGK